MVDMLSAIQMAYLFCILFPFNGLFDLNQSTAKKSNPAVFSHQKKQSK